MIALHRWFGRWVGVVCLLLALTHLAGAQATITVSLEPAAGSNAVGAATLNSTGEGTWISLDLSGMTPDSHVGVTMNAGDCATPSASGVQLPALAAGSDGRATGAGMILFRGSENIALRDIADGAHVISVAGLNGAVACGLIPSLTLIPTENAAPVAATTIPWLPIGLAIVAIILALVGAIQWCRRVTYYRHLR